MTPVRDKHTQGEAHGRPGASAADGRAPGDTHPRRDDRAAGNPGGHVPSAPRPCGQGGVWGC